MNDIIWRFIDRNIDLIIIVTFFFLEICIKLRGGDLSNILFIGTIVLIIKLIGDKKSAEKNGELFRAY